MGAPVAPAPCQFFVHRNPDSERNTLKCRTPSTRQQPPSANPKSPFYRAFEDASAPALVETRRPAADGCFFVAERALGFALEGLGLRVSWFARAGRQNACADPHRFCDHRVHMSFPGFKAHRNRLSLVFSPRVLQ